MVVLRGMMVIKLVGGMVIVIGMMGKTTLDKKVWMWVRRRRWKKRELTKFRQWTNERFERKKNRKRKKKETWKYCLMSQH